MKFFKNSVYVIFTVAIINLAFNLYMYRELKKPSITIQPDPRLAEFQVQSMMRDTQLLQGILMIHHDREMHPAGTQQLCPLCDKHNQLKSIIVQKEQ